MESKKKKSLCNKTVTIIFSESDGKRIRTAANLRKESMSKFVRTTVRERLRSLGYFSEDEQS